MEFAIDDRFSILEEMVRNRINYIIFRINNYDNISGRLGRDFPAIVEEIRKHFEKVSAFIDSLDENEKMALLGSWDIEGDAEFIEDWLSNH